VKFFFADSLDLVDPSFDFITEKRSDGRIRQQDDHYPHEVFGESPYQGMLVSKAIVDGIGGGGSSRYTTAQRQRLFRDGIRRFLRLPQPLETMGDCGAFTYVKEDIPPYTVEAVAEFYASCDFDMGLSVDHVILGFDEDYDTGLPGLDTVPPAWRRRQEITLDLAEKFLALRKRRRLRFEPVGVVQGWSPVSYANAAIALQKMGYHRIALGGLVPLKTEQIHSALTACSKVRKGATQFHLLGVTRLNRLNEFAALGATTFDTTSPLRQAFKDDKDNYHVLDGSYLAVRVPQVDGNPRLQRRIRAGEIRIEQARRLEQRSLEALQALDRDPNALDGAVDAVIEYEELWNGTSERAADYRRTLGEAPWRTCPCEVCRAIGVHVVIFRGAERNRRRGFHNLKILQWRLSGHEATRSGPPLEVLGAQKRRRGRAPV
jgi:hypothetical protein